MEGLTCPHCGRDMVNTCPTCGKEMELYSRIVGYLRPVSTWNPGKRQEFMDRREYVVNSLDENCLPNPHLLNKIVGHQRGE